MFFVNLFDSIKSYSLRNEPEKKNGCVYVDWNLMYGVKNY